MERHGGMILEGDNPKYLEKNISQFHAVHYKCHVD
jgi:hypothetical protein